MKLINNVSEEDLLNGMKHYLNEWDVDYLRTSHVSRWFGSDRTKTRNFLRELEKKGLVECYLPEGGKELHWRVVDA